MRSKCLKLRIFGHKNATTLLLKVRQGRGSKKWLPVLAPDAPNSGKGRGSKNGLPVLAPDAPNSGKGRGSKKWLPVLAPDAPQRTESARQQDVDAGSC